MKTDKTAHPILGVLTRVVALIVAFAFAAALGYRGYDAFAKPQTVSAAATYRFSAVQQGNLAATVASTGSLVPNNQAKLSFQTSGKLAELDVKVGDAVKAGAVLAKLDTTTLQQALDQAQLNLLNAQASLAKLQSTNQQAPLDQAKLNLQDSQLNLAKLQAPPTSQSVTVAKAALDKAAIAVQNAQAAYDKISWRGNVGMTPEAQALQSATIDYQSAQAQYQQALQGTTTSQDIQLAQNAVKLAQSQADQATANVQAAAQDLITQQDAVKLAQLQVDQAKTNLQGATIVAPFDGTVASVGANLGEQVGSTPLITLVNLNSMHVEANLAETDMAKVKVGETVNVTFDSLPGLTLPGTLTAVAPSGAIQSGVNTYTIYVTLTKVDPRLLAGLTSTANVVTQQVNNVLNIPNRAIKLVNGVKTVAVEQPDGSVVMQQVQTGLSNDTNTEITAGLTKGEMVGIATTASAATTAAPSGGGLLGGLRVGGGPGEVDDALLFEGQ